MKLYSVLTAITGKHIYKNNNGWEEIFSGYSGSSVQGTVCKAEPRFIELVEKFNEEKGTVKHDENGLSVFLPSQSFLDFCFELYRVDSLDSEVVSPYPPRVGGYDRIKFIRW